MQKFKYNYSAWPDIVQIEFTNGTQFATATLSKQLIIINLILIGDQLRNGIKKSLTET